MIDVADNNAVYYYHFYGLGSIVALSNNSGEIVERYSYDVFGEPNTTSSIGNSYLFTGRRYDDETGLYYYRARYYKLDIGRFMQVDPLGTVPNGGEKNPFGPLMQYQEGMNLYTYVGNNPVNGTDPYGLITSEECWALYNDRVRESLASQRDCMIDCGFTPITVGTGLCAISCAKTGPFFKVCFAGCTGTMAIVNATCHALCARITNNEIESAKRALKICLNRAACD